MRNFLRRNWGKILLAVLLIIVSVLSFKFGYSYLSNDNYSPDLDPLLTIERSLESPAWRSYRVLGFASESEQADVFRSCFYYILDLFLPTWSLSQVFALLCLFVGSWFTGLLASNLIKDTDKKKYSELVFLLGGIFYVSTLWTVWVYYQNMFPYITQFGFLPLVVWSIYRLIKNFTWKNALLLFFSSILFTSTFVIATLFVVDIVVILIFTLIFALTYSKGLKSILKKVFLTLLLFVSTQLFWILPFIHYTTNVSGDIVNSYTNRSITTSVIDLEARDQDALNSAKLFTRTVLEEQDGEYVFEEAEEYAKYDFFDAIGLIPAIFTLILFVFSLIKKKKKLIYFILSLLSVLVWFVIKNVNPPLGSVFIWVQDNIPLFKQVFRWASSKTMNIYLLLLSVCAPVGFIYLIDFLGGFLKKGLKYILFVFSTLVVIVPTLFYAQYLFSGDIYPERAIVEVPDEYYELGDYLEDKGLTEARILYLPMANNNYFRSYDWGFWGSNFTSYIIPNPIMDLSSSIGSEYGENAILEIQEAFRARDLETFENLISKYEIDYLLIDKTLNEDGFTYSWDWDDVSILWEGDTTIYSTANLYLYDTDFQKNDMLVESNSQEAGTFIYEGRTESIEISLDPEVYSNWDLEDGFLVSDNEYSGDDLILNNEISIENILKQPTLIGITNSSLYLYPAVPTIEKVNTDVYQNYEYNNSDIVVVDSNVFDKSELRNMNIGIEYSFGLEHEIYSVNDSEFSVNNLTSTLSESTPYECVSGEKEKSTTVTLQGDATGFELEGEDGKPCIYSQIDFNNRDSDKVLKVNINWETINDSLLGYCIYSENEQKCLNDEKYFSTQDGIGDIEAFLDRTISKTDYISLIIYSMNTYNKPDVTIRNVSVSYALVETKMGLIDQNISEYENTVLLENGDTYQIKVPILKGSNSYQLSENSTVWQPNITEEGTFVTYNNGFGIYQKVQGGFANSSINLFTTQASAKYLVYWKEENISNIPANICIAYSGDNKCWVQDILYDNAVDSNLKIFSSDEREDRFDLSLVSTSYELVTENILNDLVVMKYPEQWRDLSYSPQSVNTRYQVEAETVGNSLSTTYIFGEDSSSNDILTIPQASESGWIAISFKNNIPNIFNKKVTVNGWKQGWDISNVDYDNIYVIYYPNLLAYLGYILLIAEFLVITINLIKRKHAG